MKNLNVLEKYLEWGVKGNLRGRGDRHNTETILLKLVSCSAYSANLNKVAINLSETFAAFMTMQLVKSYPRNRPWKHRVMRC
jgi:hypothetical protein